MTESTKKAARCFYALSQGRADSKRYPAIDPLESYSKYLEYPEIEEYLDGRIEKGWVEKVYAGKTLAARRPTTRSTSWATTACRWSTTNDSGNRS